METTQVNDRKFARFEVELNARFRLVEAEQIETLGEELLAAPSVWGPVGESELWKLADSPLSGGGLVARAVLDLAGQVERLSRRVLNPDGPMEVAQIQQLSGGGARMSTMALLKKNSFLLLSLMDEEREVPPLRALAEVVHVGGAAPAPYGVAFRVIHPADKERLIRFIYQLQRRQLRNVQREPE